MQSFRHACSLADQYYRITGRTKASITGKPKPGQMAGSLSSCMRTVCRSLPETKVNVFLDGLKFPE